MKAPSHIEETLSLHIQAAKLPAPAREFAFEPGRRFRFDFAYPDRKIAIECEGGIYSRGRHVRPAGFEKDAEKYNLAALRGWLVLRFTAGMIRSGEALQMIEAALRQERAA